MTWSPSSTRRRRTHLDQGKPIAEKDGEDVEDHEDDTEDAVPESIVRPCPRRESPAAAELRASKRKLHAACDAYARLLALKIEAHDIGPASRKHLHQDVLTRFRALVKHQGPRGGDVKPGAGRRKPRLEHRPSRARTRHACGTVYKPHERRGAPAAPPRDA